MASMLGMKLPLVGRAAEVEEANTALTLALSGRAAALLIEGEPGIGKSRLLREIEVIARGRGFELFIGSAHELGASGPFEVFADFLRDERTAHSFEAVFDKAESISVENPRIWDESFNLIEAIVEWFEERTARAPVMLALEDLHWAGTSALTAIAALARHLPDRPLLIAGTFRSLAHRKAIDRLLDHLTATGGRVLRLAALSRDATTELLERALEAVPGQELQRLAEAAGGNPLFLLELLRTLDQQHALHRQGDHVDTSTNVVPPDLRQMLLLRSSFLPEATLDMLRLMAVLGTSRLASELAAVSGRPPVELLTELRPAVAAGVVDGAGDRLTFRHEMFRQALYEDVPPALRSGLHQEVSRVLAGVNAPATRVAEHVELAGATDSQAPTWYWRAAQECARHSVPSAVHWYERTLKVMREQDSARLDLVIECAPLLVLSGRVAEAESLASTAFANTDDRSAKVRLAVVVAHALVRQGRWREAGKQITLAARQFTDPQARDIALGPNTYLQLMLGQVADAVTQAERTLAAARQRARPVAEATALMTLTLGASAEGAVDRAVEFGRESISATAATAGTSFDGFLIADVCLGVAQMDSDRLAEARATYQEGLANASRAGIASVLAYYQSNLAIVDLHAGVWDDARTGAGACLALARDTTTCWNLHVIAVLARIAIARDELDAAEKLVSDAEDELRMSGPVMGADWVLWAKFLLLEARQQRAEAAAVACRAWDLLPELRFLQTWKVTGIRSIGLVAAGNIGSFVGGAAFALAGAGAGAAIGAVTGGVPMIGTIPAGAVLGGAGGAVVGDAALSHGVDILLDRVLSEEIDPTYAQPRLESMPHI